MTQYLGQLAALGAALMWTLSAVITQYRGTRLDGGAVNYGRLGLGLILLSVVTLVKDGRLLPVGAPFSGWLWLLLSGLIGFAVGDTFLLHAFIRIGARLTLLIFSFAPVITALLSYFLFGEGLTGLRIAGMLLVLGGVMLVVSKSSGGEKRPADGRGYLFGLVAAVGQALGALLSKAGLQNIDPLPATQIRLLGGLAGMTLLFVATRKLSLLRHTFVLPGGRLVILASAVLGTLFGVVLSMVALKLTQGAVASTLMSTMPVLILPISVWVLKEKLTPRDVLGAVLSVAGMAMLFI